MMVFIQAVHVKGADGGVFFTYFDDWTDDIYVNVKDAKGFNHTYYGEAKHLRDWCKDHGYQLYHQILEVEVEDPWESGLMT